MLPKPPASSRPPTLSRRASVRMRGSAKRVGKHGVVLDGPYGGPTRPAAAGKLKTDDELVESLREKSVRGHAKTMDSLRGKKGASLSLTTLQVDSRKLSKRMDKLPSIVSGAEMLSAPPQRRSSVMSRRRGSKLAVENMEHGAALAELRAMLARGETLGGSALSSGLSASAASGDSTPGDDGEESVRDARSRLGSLLPAPERVDERTKLELFKSRLKDVSSKPPAARSEEDLDALVTFLEGIEVLSRTDMSTITLREIARNMTLRHYDSNSIVIRQGDVGNEFFMILDGFVEVRAWSDGGVDAAGRPRRASAGVTAKSLRVMTKLLAIFTHGSSFGHWALMEDTPRSATIITREPCDLFVLNREEYRCVRLKQKQVEELRMTFLHAMPGFTSWDNEQLRSLSQCLVSVTQPPKTVVIKQGSQADCMYFIRTGKVRVLQRIADARGRMVLVELAEQGPFETFGGLDLFDSTVTRDGSVAAGVSIVTRTTVELLKLPKVEFAKRIEQFVRAGFREQCASTYPLAPDDVIDLYQQNLRWEAYKRTMTETIAARLHKPRSLRAADVPMPRAPHVRGLPTPYFVKRLEDETTARRRRHDPEAEITLALDDPAMRSPSAAAATAAKVAEVTASAARRRARAEAKEKAAAAAEAATQPSPPRHMKRSRSRCSPTGDALSRDDVKLLAHVTGAAASPPTLSTSASKADGTRGAIAASPPALPVTVSPVRTSG
eukprot:PLAT2607.2.p1 GENE.PLAT2607.2~~PLAT2607.2.p1  ORF type:complete len:724 (-),score=290.15 PLAT2607.2:180-2351(-)